MCLWYVLKSVLTFITEKTSAKVDQECLVFWIDNVPHLNSRKCDEVTFRGENLYNIRADVTLEELQYYIEAFYRILTPSSLVENLRTLPKSSIQNVKAYKGIAEVNNPGPQQSSSGTKIMFNYEKKKEIVGFEQRNASRYLAYMLLSKTVPSCIIPIDIFEAKIFFKKYFEGDVRDVFNKCCEHNEEDAEKVLEYYRHKLNWSKFYSKSHYEAYNPKKTERRSDSLACIFMQLTSSKKKY